MMFSKAQTDKKLIFFNGYLSSMPNKLEVGLRNVTMQAYKKTMKKPELTLKLETSNFGKRCAKS